MGRIAIFAKTYLMKIVKHLIVASIFMAMSQSSAAQEAPAPPTNGKNMLKVNLTGLVIRNYSFQYERVLNRKLSLAVSYRFMPSGPIPFKNTIINQVGDGDQETIDQINSLKLSNSAITPELRIYLSRKGYGKGFYIAPFYRYARHDANNVTVNYESSPGVPASIDMTGRLTSNTGGLMIGAQWNLGKSLVLDWWILGPHFGKGKGELNGVSSVPLSSSAQADLKNELESIDLPFGIKQTVYVDANGARMLLDGPMAGLRAGLQLGVRF